MTAAASVLLTPRMLAIPARISAKYASIAHRFGTDAEELESVANLAFAEALAAWGEDRSPSGRDGLAPYLVQRVEWAVRNEIWIDPKRVNEGMRRRCVPLGALLSRGDRRRAVEDVLGEQSRLCSARCGPPPPDADDGRLDAAEKLRRLAGLADERVRRLLELMSPPRCLNQVEAARELGTSRQRVFQLLAALRDRAEKEGLGL